MTVVARNLSNACGLAIYADRTWTGGGCIGLGMVFMGISMGDNLRTPEDDQKLKKIEQTLAELDPKASNPVLFLVPILP